MAAIACDGKSRSKVDKEPEPSERLQRVFAPQDFAPLRDPEPGDWLAEHEEPGQSYMKFLSQRPNFKTDERHTIYFLPIGESSTDSASIDVLRDYAVAYYTLPVVVLERVSVDEIGATSRINSHTNEPQLLTSDILRALKKRIPDDAYAMIGLTDADLYPEDSWNFVFGQASLVERVGVWSFARYHPSFYETLPPDADKEAARKLALVRAMKVMVHELGHMFGIYHCTFYSCVMNGSNNLREADGSPLHLCPVELRKLHHTVGFDPVERYRKLARFYERHDFADAAAWVRSRIARIVE